MINGHRTREYRQQLEATAGSDVCHCGLPLLVAMDPADGYALRCSDHGYGPETRQRHEQSPMQRWMAGKSVDNLLERQQVWNALKKRVNAATSNGDMPEYRDMIALERMERAMTNPQPQAVVAYQSKTLMTEAEANKFVNLAAIFTNEELRKRAVALCQQTGLNPILGELTVFQNQLYIPVKGLRHLLLMADDYLGEEEPEFAAADKRDAMGFRPDEIVVILRSHRRGRRGVITGIGSASRDPKKAFNNSQVEVNFGPRTAENRAFRQMFIKGWWDLLYGHNVLIDVPDDIATGSGALPFVRDVPEGIDAETGEYMDESGPVIVGEYREAASAPEFPTAPRQASFIARFGEQDQRLELAATTLGQSTAALTAWIATQQVWGGLPWANLSLDVRDAVLAHLDAQLVKRQTEMTATQPVAS